MNCGRTADVGTSKCKFQGDFGMLDASHFDYFGKGTIALTVVLSIISSVLGTQFSRKLRKTGYSARKNAGYSSILAFTFWLTHLFIIQSVSLSISDKHSYYFAIHYLFCLLGSYIALKVAQKPFSDMKQHLYSSAAVAFSILAGDYIAFYFLFSDSIRVTPILMAITSVLALGSSLSILRFLSQVTNEETDPGISNWKVAGQISVGISLAGIPFIVMVSLLDFGKNLFPSNEELLFLTPFAFVIAANVILMLVPDSFFKGMLAKKSQSYLSLFNHNPDPVFWVSSDGTILETNREASKFTGYSRKELIGLSFTALLKVNAELEKVESHFKSILDGELNTIDSVAVIKDGAVVDVKIIAVRIIINQKVIGVYGIVKDITNEKKSDALIKSLAYSDDLTNLPNKRRLELEIQELIARQQEFALMYIDFDRFKRINDTFGHFFGDRVIRAIGKRLGSCMARDCLIARMGGDEFSIIVPDLEMAEELAETIINRFRSPIILDGYEFLITASIGIARFPSDSANLADLMKDADVAMNEAKQDGANTYKIFSKEMNAKKFNQLELENDLRNAIKAGSLQVYYQPKYNIVTQQVIGSEALVRWNHPKYGFISPGVFIPIAEEAHLIIQLERAVFTEVFRSIKRWKQAGFHVPRTSVNVSVIHFYQEDFIDFIIQSMMDFGLQGSDLEIEVTESIMMKSESSIDDDLQVLRDIGIEISIDDFGTGYNSLSYLQKLSIDRLKIDQSFIANSSDNPEIISTIISMARTLKLAVIAEGVETNEQIQLLNSLGCNEVQGFYYSPAIENGKYQALLETQEAC